MAEDKKKSDSDEATFAIIVGGAIALLLAPAALVALLAWFLLRRLGRIEGALITGLGIFGLWLGRGDYVSQYWSWWPGMFWDAAEWWQVPALPLLLVAAVFTGIALMLQGTAIAAKVPTPFRKKDNPLEVDEIIPDSAGRELTKVAAPPQGLLPDIEDHSLMSKKETSRLIPIGVGLQGKPVCLTEAELGYPSVVFGATGSGKSVYLMTLIAALLDLGWDGLVIDQKEDTKPGGLRDFLATYASTHSIPYQELRLSDPDPQYFFNPFRGMPPDEAADAILTLAPADDFFWGAMSQNMTRQGVTLLYAAHEADPVKHPFPDPYTLATIFREGPSMATFTKEMRAAVLMQLAHRFTKDDFRAMSQPSEPEQKNAQGFSAKILTMYQSAAGRASLRPGQRADGSPKLELDVTRGGITYIGLDSLGKPELTTAISAFTLQRMNVEASKRTTGSASAVKPMFLIIDEANTVNRKILQNMVSRARSARITPILATQGPLDWNVEQATGKGQGAAGFNALAQNINVAIIMNQGEPESAQVCAEFLGTREVFQTSQRITEDGLIDATARANQDYYVSPQKLRELEIGEAVIRVSRPGYRVEYVRVAMRDAEAILRRRR